MKNSTLTSKREEEEWMEESELCNVEQKIINYEIRFEEKEAYNRTEVIWYMNECHNKLKQEMIRMIKEQYANPIYGEFVKNICKEVSKL